MGASRRTSGSGQDRPAGLALHGDRALVAGSTQSADFPTTAGALAGSALGGQDGFAARLAPEGRSLDYATYLGGSGDDSITALADGRDGTLLMAGATASTDFPTTAGALSSTLHGPRDATLLRLAPGGASLVHPHLQVFGGETPPLHGKCGAAHR